MYSGITRVARVLVAGFAISSIVACSESPTIGDADNDQVITLGDSIFQLSGELQANLEAEAGETFRRYTQSGAELSGGTLAPSVYEQYSIALGDNPDIDTIVMNGGGNDILIPAILGDPYGCRTQWWKFGRLSRSCRNYIDDIYVEAVNLLNTMQQDLNGEVDVIYLGYYYTKGFVDNLEEAVDYGDGALDRACENATVSCTFVDPRATIRDSDIIADGIHPASSGSQKLADLIWPVLAPLLNDQ
ncbi:MAG: SGNH/GDSL hydrolase family protein [Pseudomonadota bacterium]